MLKKSRVGTLTLSVQGYSDPDVNKSFKWRHKSTFTENVFSCYGNDMNETYLDNVFIIRWLHTTYLMYHT